jgi:Zn-dependent M28 family amino/carboxypeptidase
MILLLQRQLHGRPVLGANGNASGVAAALAVAEALQRDRPAHVETWFLFTSGEEAGLAGMIRFLSDNRFNRETTYFVNLDNVGAGRVRYTTAEGMIIPLQSSPILVRIAGEVAAMHPDWRARPIVHHLLPTDQFAALARGYQAISIMAYDDHERIPNWHQPTDTVDNVNLATVRTAADLALGIVRRLDGELAHSDRDAQPRNASPVIDLDTSKASGENDGRSEEGKL